MRYPLTASAAVLRKTAKRLDITQIELAERLGVPPDTLSGWLSKGKCPAHIALQAKDMAPHKGGLPAVIAPAAAPKAPRQPRQDAPPRIVVHPRSPREAAMLRALLASWEISCES